MKKILIFGASGFIGSNLVEILKRDGTHEVHGLDIVNSEYADYCCDVLDENNLKKLLELLKPEIVIFCAARTDLRGKNFADYEVNFIAPMLYLKLVGEIGIEPYTIFFSSMLAKQFKGPAYSYGHSKDIMEKLITTSGYQNMVIVRPTSIFGPRMGAPYKGFFEMLLFSRLVVMPRISDSAVKTFGFVLNLSNQIQFLIFNQICLPTPIYVGDIEPVNITQFAILIRKNRLIKNQLVLYPPALLLYFASRFGDFLKYFVKWNFPLTSYRYDNLTKNRIIDMTESLNLFGGQLYSLEESIAHSCSHLINKK